MGRGPGVAVGGGPLARVLVVAEAVAVGTHVARRGRLRTLTTPFQSSVLMVMCGMSAPINRAAIVSSASPAGNPLNAGETVYCRPACCDAPSAEAAMLRERCCLASLALVSFSVCFLRSSVAKNSATSAGTASQHEMPRAAEKSADPRCAHALERERGQRTSRRSSCAARPCAPW